MVASRLAVVCLVMGLSGCDSELMSSTPGPAVGANGGRSGSPSAGASGTSALAGRSGQSAGSGGTASASPVMPGSPSMPPAQAGSGGSAGTNAGAGGANAGAGGNAAVAELDPFSFFVTSLVGLQRLSKSEDGFGGDLRYGEADGLLGADKICTELAEASMPGSGAKQWRAFLSVAEGPEGSPIHAIDRVGDGPWYDRLGRLVAMNRAALPHPRPMGADPAIIDDLPNEDGVPNHAPDGEEVDNHHVLTGSTEEGELYTCNYPSCTCDDWTSTAADAGRPRVGFSWPGIGGGGRLHWISGQDEGGCGAGVRLVEMGGSNPQDPVVGSGGGYGAIYCFALTP
jgi:hypothetical protein